MTLQCKLQATHTGSYVLINKLERRSFFNVVKSQLENEFANRITVPSHTGVCPGGGAQRPLGPKKNLETTADLTDHGGEGAKLPKSLVLTDPNMDFAN